MSATSNRVTPASRAASITARTPSTVAVTVPGRPRLLQPRPVAETARPEWPSRRSVGCPMFARLTTTPGRVSVELVRWRSAGRGPTAGRGTLEIMRAESGAPRPGWSALRVGPGGVPPELVRPIGLPDPPRPAFSGPAAFGSDPSTAPHAVLGSFDDGKPRRRAILAVTCLGLVALVVVIAGLLSSGTGGSGSSADLRTGDCLASSGGTTVIALDCDAPEAEFVIAARFDSTTDDRRCTATA